MSRKFALSQSAIKKWKDTPPNIWYKQWVTKELPRPSSTATHLGSYLHALILKPEDVEKNFVISDKELPSDKLVKVINNYYFALVDHRKALEEKAAEENKEVDPKEVLQLTLDHTDILKRVCQEADYFKTQPDRAVKEVLKNSDYFNFLITTEGKTIITSDEHADAVGLKDILLNDPMSKGFFIPKKNCEVLFETSIFHQFELVGYDNLEFMPVRGFIDIIHMNHKRKEVREVDLKYTDDAFSGFFQKVRLFDYPLQHSFYDFLLREWLKVYKDGAYAGYVVMNPINVVIDSELRVPYIYEYNYNDLHIKRYGIENTNIKGWEDTLNEIAWHMDNDDWSRPKFHIENKKLEINIFKR